VEYFHIYDTRSLHSDTLSLGLSAAVDGDIVAHRVLANMDSFDNGEYSPRDYVPDDGGLNEVVLNDPLATTGFAFQLVNAGHVTGDPLNGYMLGAAKAVLGKAAKVAGAASAFTPVGLLLGAFSQAWSWLSADCDGPVAVDQLSGPR
jgi:hypothetical protein